MNNYKIKFFFTAVIIVGFSAIFFLNTSVVIDGLQNGLTICGSSVISSLFPFIVLSDFIIRSGFGSIIGAKIAPLTEKLFKLPGSAGCAIIMSLIGGFPVGAKMTAQLYECGEITQADGRRMLTFCINAGPAFVVGTVGASMISSEKAGIILLFSTTIASLILGFISRFFAEKVTDRKAKIKKHFNPAVLTESVNQSVQTIFIICAWITLFSGVNALLSQLSLSNLAKVWLTMLTEVTNGCLNASRHFPTCIIALTLGWAGLAVHCQVLPYLLKLNMKVRYFWISRLLAGGLSCVISLLLFKLFPCEISTFAGTTQFTSRAYSVSVPVAVSMLFLSALLLIDIKPCMKEKLVL